MCDLPKPDVAHQSKFGEAGAGGWQARFGFSSHPSAQQRRLRKTRDRTGDCHKSIACSVDAVDGRHFGR